MRAKKFTKETICKLGVQDRVFPEFHPGDTIIVQQFIKEGEKTRLQAFEGDVIAMRRGSASGSFTVRKIGSHSIAVERIYPFNTPLIDSITVKRRATVRRAKLYYVRDRVGKAARFKEKIKVRGAKAA